MPLHPEGDLDIRTVRHSTSTTVIVAGDLDFASADLFRSVVLPLLASGGLPVVAVLDQVTFVDSSGLGALLDANRRAEHVGGSFLLAAPSPVLVQRLSQTRLDTVFSLVDPPGADGQ